MAKIIVYDFDGTLTPYALPKFELLEKSGLENGAYNPKFLELSRKRAKDKNIDLYTAIYETYFEIVKKAGFKLTDENFSFGYDNIVYNRGVPDFLKMLSRNNVANYLLSSGVKVFLEKVSIAEYFKEIYATTFIYNQDLEVTAFDFLMSDKNKVAALKEILRKNEITDEDCSDVVYIGDGLTDYYVMKYIREHGGTSIFAYLDANSKDMQSIKEKDVVDFYMKADFSSGSELNECVRKLCKIKTTQS